MWTITEPQYYAICFFITYLILLYGRPKEERR